MHGTSANIMHRNNTVFPVVCKSVAFIDWNKQTYIKSITRVHAITISNVHCSATDNNREIVTAWTERTQYMLRFLDTLTLY